MLEELELEEEGEAGRPKSDASASTTGVRRTRGRRRGATSSIRRRSTTLSGSGIRCDLLPRSPAAPPVRALDI